MSRPGRRPLAERHVDGLAGSELAKQRLTLILKTMRGEVTIPQAAGELGVCESRFHAMRHRWLEASLQLLEPRRMGRPPTTTESSDEVTVELRAEVERLRKELAMSQAAREVQSILSAEDEDEGEASSGDNRARKSKAASKKKRLQRRRQAEKRRRKKGTL